MEYEHQIPLPPLAVGGAFIAQRFGPAGKRAAKLRRAAAVVLTAGSGALALGAVRSFTRHQTTLDPRNPSVSSALITAGSNSITRNPMYVGALGVLCAHALWRGSLRAWAPVGAAALLLDNVQIPREEADLAKSFGKAYTNYQTATPRWVDQRSVAAFRAILSRP